MTGKLKAENQARCGRDGACILPGGEWAISALWTTSFSITNGFSVDNLIKYQVHFFANTTVALVPALFNSYGVNLTQLLFHISLATGPFEASSALSSSRP